jgi:photosystem II stability/assembly factor-like uncharacterized protein
MSRLKKQLRLWMMILIFLIIGYDGFAKHQDNEAPLHRLYHDLFSVSFPTPAAGWACGRWGTILHTADGGKTWARQESGIDYQLNAIMFADPNNGWAVGDGGVIVHTGDGGNTWKTQKSPSHKILLSVHFVTPENGWAVGEETTILHTQDGGTTWRAQSVGDPWTLHSVSFFDKNCGWAAGEYGFIYHTADGGVSWLKQAGKFALDPDEFLVIADNYLLSVKAISSENAVAVGIDGTIVRTTDAGANWQPVSTDLPAIHLFGVSVRDGELFIAARKHILTGSIAGGNFKSAALTPPIPYGYVYGITARGNTGFAAVGKGGRIYMSDETGTAWHLAQY